MKQSTGPKLIIAGAEQASDMRYASGFMPVDPVVFLDEGNRRFLVVPELEYGRAKQESHRVKVLLSTELGLTRKDGRSVGVWAKALLKQRGLRRVTVPPTFPISIADMLRKRGIRIEVSDGPLYPSRAVKTRKEIACMEEVQRAAAAAVKKGVLLLRASTIDSGGTLRLGRHILTSERMKYEIEVELLSHQCATRGIIIAGGKQAADPHDTGSGPLRAGETIVLDIFPYHQKTGYWGDITRTVVKGRATPDQKRMYRAVKKAQADALTMVRAGAKGWAIHEYIREYFDTCGFPTRVVDGIPRGFFHGTGHGVGLEIHEAPSISLAAHQLARGNVVTVEPGLYDPDIGGVRIEDTVVVLKNNCRVLASCPKTFEIR